MKTRSAPWVTFITAGLMLSLLASPTAGAETIYRCDKTDGSTVFSDHPCGQSQRPYEPRQRLSIVSAAPDLNTRISRNQAFIERRRARIERQTPRGPAQQPRPNESIQSGGDQRLVVLPGWWTGFPPRADHHRVGRSSGTHDSGSDDVRFSALGGPFPGTIRREGDQ
jgi:hypothetical protein